jgi:hypothetical protein
MVLSQTNLPPLYKYLDVRGAKLTLDNRTFRHAQPSDFNDVEDLTVQSLFPEETEEALRRLTGGFTDVILRNLDKKPTCSSPQKEMLELIQQAFRTHPEAADLARTELVASFEEMYDVDYYRKKAKGYILEINEFMQSYRVLCVTTHKESERMWTDYAQKHKGICLRIEPNLAKDSKFQLFRPVTYRDKRPPLYEETLEFIAGALFGDLDARVKECVERIIYSKTLKWQHEGEYRLVCPVGENEKPWNTMAYHPEEITELYLGCEMEKLDVEDTVGKARNVNIDIKIFQARRSGGGRLVFDRL